MDVVRSFTRSLPLVHNTLMRHLFWTLFIRLVPDKTFVVGIPLTAQDSLDSLFRLPFDLEIRLFSPPVICKEGCFNPLYFSSPLPPKRWLRFRNKHRVTDMSFICNDTMSWRRLDGLQGRIHRQYTLGRAPLCFCWRCFATAEENKYII